MANLVIERVRLDTLKDFPGNPRMHPERNAEALRRSLVEFGQVEPLLVRRETREIVSGNGRADVMRSLGWQEVDVVFADLTESQAKALCVAMNRTGELAEWDFELLSELMKSIDASGYNLEVLGWCRPDLEAILQAGMLLVDKPDDVWKGMPDFNQSSILPFMEITVRFMTEDDYRTFGNLIGQNLTKQTKAIWFPKQDHDQLNRTKICKSVLK